MAALATPVEVCNLALSGYLGKPMILSFTQTGTEAAKCRLFYPLAREAIATATDWSFLRERVALSEITNDRSTEWDKAYDMPSRALKLFHLVDPNRAWHKVKEYHLSSGKIYTNLEGAYAHYVTLEDTSESDWNLRFKLALAAKLAELLAPSMTRRSSDVERFRVQAAQEVALGIEEDAGTEFVRYATDESYVNGNLGEVPVPAQPDGSNFWRS